MGTTSLRLNPLGPASSCREASFWALAAFYSLAAVLVRIPLFYNASAIFNDDEAANALTIKHLVEGKTLAFFYYGQRYQGLTEGLAALPFVCVWGWTPLPFLLSAFLAWLLVQIVGARILWKVFGIGPACAWLAMQTFVPVESLWASTQAHGGHFWVLLWAYASLVIQESAWCRKALGMKAILALMGLQFLGLYTYSYYLLFVPLLVGFHCIACRGGCGRRLWLGAIVFGVPCIAVWGLRVMADRLQGDRNWYPDFGKPYEFVTLRGWQDRWWVLRRQCLPLVLSAEGVCHGPTRLHASIWGRAVGPDGLPAWVEWAGTFLFYGQLSLFILGTCSALRRLMKRRPGGLFATGVVGSAWLSLVAFVLFQYGEQWSRARYLTPVFPGISFASVLVLSPGSWRDRSVTQRFGKQSRWSLLVLLAWAVYYGRVDLCYYRAQGMLRGGWVLERVDSPATVLASWCLRAGWVGPVGYADYRLAYPVSYLTREQVRLCPWDLARIPSYQQEAAEVALPKVFTLELSSRLGAPELRGLRFRRWLELPVGRFRVVVWEPETGSPNVTSRR
jgi:hypothetical protein